MLELEGNKYSTIAAAMLYCIGQLPRPEMEPLYAQCNDVCGKGGIPLSLFLSLIEVRVDY